MDILIIDDMQEEHDLVMARLKNICPPIRFYHAYDASQGFKIYQDQHIDCVLLDYHMPGQDGLELLGQLTNGGGTVPVIMMTGEGDEYIAVTAMKMGAQDYIPKRFATTSALKRAVERTVERTEMIRRMEQYKLELERNNRDLEQFSNIVAHDLKAPLRAITQHLTLISHRAGPALDDHSKRSLDFAVEGAQRMRLLIEALFEYARLGFSEVHFETVNLETTLAQTQQDLSVVMAEKQAVITHDPLPYIHGDRLLLAQLLQNLIANAIKYCSETPHIHVSAVEEADSWRISVADNGIGIPPAQHKQVFAIFRRLHAPEEYPGIGLGLAICDRIVKLHGGSIGVDSQAGKGSIFYFHLPKPEIQEQSEKKAANA